MRDNVNIYIKKSCSCQINKHITYTKYCEIKHKKSSNVLQNKVIIEYIVKSLKLKDLKIKKEYNLILMILDKLTKYSFIILFRKNFIKE